MTTINLKTMTKDEVAQAIYDHYKVIDFTGMGRRKRCAAVKDFYTYGQLEQIRERLGVTKYEPQTQPQTQPQPEGHTGTVVDFSTLTREEATQVLLDLSAILDLSKIVHVETAKGLAWNYYRGLTEYRIKEDLGLELPKSPKRPTRAKDKEGLSSPPSPGVKLPGSNAYEL